MRGVVILLSGAVMAFLFTSGAFLLLANLGSNPSERSLAPAPARSGPFLELSFTESELGSLQPARDQRLRLGVRNGREEAISNVNVTLKVSSEDTALSEVRYYRATVRRLAPGESASVPFEVDLSPPEGPSGTEEPGTEEPYPVRMILEAQATMPEGLSAVKTAILPF